MIVVLNISSSCLHPAWVVAQQLIGRSSKNHQMHYSSKVQSWATNESLLLACSFMACLSTCWQGLRDLVAHD